MGMVNEVNSIASAVSGSVELLGVCYAPYRLQVTERAFYRTKMELSDVQ
jgi:hypothetical protein